MLRRVWRNYLERHQDRRNQLLHLVGVPLTFVVSIVLLIQGEWAWAIGAFIAGYVLQFIGHAIEGNDAGEMVLIKKLMGKPYVAVASRPNASKSDD